MEPLTRANGLQHSPGAALFIAHKQGTPAPEEKYTGLLQKIARNFGFSESEAGELIQKTFADSHKEDPASPLPQRMRLAKGLVHKCVFTISTSLFRQCGCPAEKGQPSSLYLSYRYSNAGALHLQQMPLSFRAVYILNHLTGFTEHETAAILNTTVLSVKERNARARSFLEARCSQGY